MKMTTDTPIAPYFPVAYTVLESRVFNFFASRDIQFNARFGQVDVTVTLGFDRTTFPYRVLDQAHKADLAFEAAGNLWQVSFHPTRFLYELLETADDSGFFSETPPETLPEPVIWALLEGFLSPDLARLEGVLGTAVTFSSPVSPVPPGTLSIPFILDFQGRDDIRKSVHGFFHLPFKAAGIELMEKALARFPVRIWEDSRAGMVKKTIFFEIGRLNIVLRDLRRLRAGDVLLPNQWYPLDNRIALRISPLRLFCEYETGNAEAIVSFSEEETVNDIPAGLPETGRDGQTGNQDMTEKETSRETSAQTVAADTGRLEMDLTFEIGKTIMTIEEISKLSQGQVVRLPHKIEDGVPTEIRSNNQLIAKGRIINISGDVGVQITQILGG